ncbi:thymidine phosphorylase [Aeoliella mucimassa]|uniref:thymidine phosphorylase n=1 Tax=Aeoliella mucimassa TaxID=2527972 RepID=A0A518AJN9_9BACT|nr:thymidine phosphorylase [Aeoliella mucimassa]QDU54949.1 Pyrimidine-nucleoside phosphorylase [Aeoliella mucimassa]
MNPTFLIAKKRDGGELTDGEIADLVRGYVAGEVADYQMSAFTMAVCCRGMSIAETASITEHMLHSGVTLEWPGSDKPEVDKHSTGGIGDKVSLPLAAMLACCGLRVPMISGRGLGATGGTLDKLESIPGFQTNLPLDEMRRVVDQVGCVINGATKELVPADRMLYALRDVTATIESIPLITASIMSKKLAEGLDALVLDVKHGSGAFMKTLDDAQKLARSMVDTGKRMGVPTVAVITDMNQPLGRLAGNAVEVDESLALLEGRGPDDLVEVTLALGAELLVMTGQANDLASATTALQATIDDGLAMEKFAEMVRAQGGDLDAVRPVAPAQPLLAGTAGYVTRIDTQEIGRAIIELGGGRRRKEDVLDLSVGVEMLVRLGDQVQVDQPLANVLAAPDAADLAKQMLRSAIEVSESPTSVPPLIVERVE